MCFVCTCLPSRGASKAEPEGMVLRLFAARFGEACGKSTFMTCSRRNCKETHRLRRLNIPSYWHSSVVPDQEPRPLTGFQTHRSCSSTDTKSEHTGAALHTHTGQHCEFTCARHTDLAHLQFLPVACASSPSAADFPAARPQQFYREIVPVKVNATRTGEGQTGTELACVLCVLRWVNCLI